MRFLFIIMTVLIFDRISKHVVQSNILLGESIPVIPGIFHLTYIENPGAAFGILANQTIFFVIVTIIVILAILLGYRYIPLKNESSRVALALIAGGALGNLFDRLQWGRVIDFFDFRVWPVFNVADVAIVIGSGILILYIWKYGQDEGQGDDDKTQK